MMYTVIYVDKNDGIRKWKKSSDLMVAEKFGSDNSDNDYDICVSLYEYGKLEEKIKRMKDTFKQIETMARTSK